MTLLYKIIIPIYFFCVIVFPLNVNAFDGKEKTAAYYNKKIRAKLDYYNKQVPQIRFLYMSNGKAWQESLQGLELVLGYQATSMDYKHPPELRQDLLFATVEKIKMMLVNHVVSSYLFKVGEQAGIDRDYACIITLDPLSTVSTNKVATRHLLDLPDKEFRYIQEEKYLDKDDHLEFIIDHEAYHCIDSYYHGGISMSQKEFWGKYSSYNRERQADMFAIAMHLYRKGEESPYINKVKMIRGMTLINGEVQHNSDEGIDLVIGVGKHQLVWKSIKDLVSIIKNLDRPIAPGYEEYLDYRVAAIEAIRKLGRKLYEVDEPVYPKGRMLNKHEVKKLIEKSRRYYEQYVGRKYPH